MESTVKCNSKERLLGHQEMLFLTLGQMEEPIGRYIHVNVLESTNRITLDIAKRAWLNVSNQNFLMKACIGEDKDKNFMFQEMENSSMENDNWIDIKEEDISQEEEFHGSVVNELQNKINFAEGPLWCVRILHLPSNKPDANSNDSTETDEIFRSVMIFFSSHIIIDGKSGVNLICNQVLPALIGQSLTTSPINFAQPMETSVYNMKEEDTLIANRNVSWSWRAIVRVFMLKLRIGNALTRKSKVDNKAGLPLNRMHTFDISEDVTMSFIRYCKAKGLSVQTLLMVVVHNALHEARSIFGLGFLNTDDLLYAIDARKFQQDLNATPTMPLGDYHKMGTQRMKYIPIVKETDGNEEINDKKLMELSKQIQKGIKEHNQPLQENTGFDCLFHLLQNQNLTTKTFNALPAPCVFTNLGNCDLISKFDNNNNVGGIRLVKQYFSLETRSGCLISVWTFEKKMYFGITHGLGEKAGQYLVENISRKIEILARK